MICAKKIEHKFFKVIYNYTKKVYEIFHQKITYTFTYVPINNAHWQIAIKNPTLFMGELFFTSS